MPQVLNSVMILAMVWLIFSGLWEVFTSGDLSTSEIQGIQMFGGFDHLATGIGLLVIFLLVRRK